MGQNYDLLSMIQNDTQLRRIASTHGGEYAGSCPFCGGEDRFRVWPERDGGRWWCRQCERIGDYITYLVETKRIDKRKAANMRRSGNQNAIGDIEGNHNRKALHFSHHTKPPGPIWQTRASDFVDKATSTLYNEEGAQALEWLHKRGLKDSTIQDARLGFNLRDTWDSPKRWGVPRDKRLWLPRGITIPWYVDADLWRVNIRRFSGDPKYIGPAGFGNGLYNAGGISSDKPVILIEGEFDALILMQVAGDLITPCATGSAQGSRCPHWEVKLAISPLVLVSFDADDAGDKARQHWLGVLPNAKYWRPPWGDVNQLHMEGYDVRSWIMSGLN